MKIEKLILVVLVTVIVSRGITLLAAPQTTNNQGRDYGDLESRSLTDVLQERSTTRDTNRANEIESYLREKAVPKTVDDLKHVETEILQKDDYRRRRGLTWLSRT